MRRVEIDPYGNGETYLGVIIQYPSGVVYAQQCSGTACEHYEIEGYFVPIEGRVIVPELIGVFHEGTACLWGKPSLDQLARLRLVVEGPSDIAQKERGLRLDETRLEEVREAWVPVITPEGPGILTWPNCD